MILEVLSLATEPPIVTEFEYFWFILTFTVGMLAIAILFLCFKGLPLRILAGLFIANIILAIYLSSPEGPDPNDIPFAAAALPGAIRAVRGVEIEASEKVGNYDVVALKVDGAAALDEWLAGNGYMKLPKGAAQTINDLARENWRFVAARLHVDDAGSSETVKPHPIMLTFPTPQPIYPMRLTAHAGSTVNLELYIVSDYLAKCSPLRLEYCGDFPDDRIDDPLLDNLPSSQESSSSTWAGLMPRTTFWPGCVLTRLSGVVAPDQMKTDYTFKLKRPREIRPTLYTRMGAFQQAGSLAMALWSLGVGLALAIVSINTQYVPFALVLLRRAPDQPNRRRACFLACLALSVCAIALYLGIDASMAKLRPSETVSGGEPSAKPRIVQYFFSEEVPGETHPHTTRVKAKPSIIDLRLRFRDKTTGQPLREVKGALAEPNELPTLLYFHGNIETVCQNEEHRTLSFFKADSTGLATMSNFKLSDNYLEREGECIEREQQNPDDEGLASLRSSLELSLVAEAPGHVREFFKIPVEQARSGKELVFGLGKEATVRGRVLLAETGEPLNKDTVRTLLERTGKWMKLREKNHGYDPSIDTKITMRNWTLVENRLNYMNSSFVEFFRVKIGWDGWFEFRGLQPHKSWICEMELTGLPNIARYHIDLKPGMNNLGDIRVMIAGELNGKIVDEQGEGVKEAYVRFPVEGLRHETPCEQTNAAGEFHFDLTSFVHDRQIMRIVPLWGIDSEDGTNDAFEEHLVYEAIISLDRTSTHTLNTRIDRGHTLIIEIPQTIIRDRMAKLYQDPKNRPYKEDSQSRIKYSERFFAVSGATIQSLEANKEGFIYHRNQVVHQGLRFTSGTMELRVDHVPPGIHALRLDGGFFATEPAIKYRPRHAVRYLGSEGRIMIVPESPPEPPKTYMINDVTIPLAYTEFEMKATTTTLPLALSPTDIEIGLSNLPTKFKDGKEIDTMVFLERKQPLSTVYTNDLRKILLQQDKWVDNDSMESRLVPMMGYGSFFTFTDPATRKLYYRPCRIPAVPPGLYRLQAFTGAEEFQKVTPAKPYFETEIRVPDDGKKIFISVPYQAK